MPRIEKLPEDAPRLDASKQNEDPEHFVGELLDYVKKRLNLAPKEALNPGERYKNNAANHLLEQGVLAEAGPNETTIVFFRPGADDHKQPVQKKVVVQTSDGKLRLYPYSERTVFILQPSEKIGIAHNASPPKNDVFPATIPVVLATVKTEAI